jgi:serine protease Do
VKRPSLRAAALGLVASCALVPAAGCGGKPAAAPVASAPNDCAELVSRMDQYGDALVLASQEESQRQSLASALRMVRVVKRWVGELDTTVAPMTFHDAALRTRVEAYHASAGDLAKGADELTTAIEATATALAPRVTESLGASKALDEACGAKGADCAAMKDALGGTTGVTVSWDDPASVAKVRSTLNANPPKGTAARRAQARLLDALDALLATANQVQHSGDAPLKHFQHAGAQTKHAVEDLRQYCAKTTAPAGSREWVTGPKEDQRALTVVVRFKPPGSLASDFEAAAQTATQEYGALYRAAAAGGFGSGFVVVRSEGKRVFIVTNRHVVDVADHVTVMRADGSSYRARIVYSDPHYDLAVLALEDEGPFDHGFAFETETAKDQQPVVATGFPGLANEPSYQITKGYVSNDRFELDTDGLKLTYIQHTAPIDRGSSGGPLMDDAGKVLGVNTLKAFGRENVAFAAPASAVIDALRYASTLDTRLGSLDFRRQTFRDDCLDLVAELAAQHPRTTHAEQLVSTRMIAEQGVASYNLLSDGDRELTQLWEQDPVEALRFALVRRVWKEVGEAGGVDPTETCGSPNATDWNQILTTDRVRVPIRVGGGTREIVMRWEQGRWKLARMEFAPPAPPKATKAAKPAKKTRKK